MDEQLKNDIVDADQPLYDGERRFYVICSTPRTGSSYLCQLIRAAGYGVPMEYFHKRNHIPKLVSHFGLLDTESESVTIEQYIGKLLLYRTSPNGYFGFKAHKGQFKWLRDQVDIEEKFPGLKYVYIYRRNLLAQAVSESKAVQTRQWASYQSSAREPLFDREHITYCLKTLKKSNDYWRQYFASNRLDVLEVSYEEIDEDAIGALRRVLGHIGAGDLEEDINIGPIQSKRQFDATNMRWMELYRRGDTRE